ncbi:hypothetical protein C4D60_Mb04t16600 [Musa balbisiana]|uniref:Piezo-type mechanosensitive ion channel homolog domain-containing protein n=1 Tax=Musa balbisiana TaxID=52838 RepID=A0A4S8KCI6_MUSBA|nr:hypothetical protein C4D60_Mb04t16600 [Musa balbisiana]
MKYTVLLPCLNRVLLATVCSFCFFSFFSSHTLSLSFLSVLQFLFPPPCHFSATSFFALSGKKHTNVLLRGSVFRNFSINFFTYGFPGHLISEITPAEISCKVIYESLLVSVMSDMKQIVLLCGFKWFLLPLFCSHYRLRWLETFFEVLLFSLSFWSFSFTSICAFGLLAYVGYVLFSFPSLVELHRLNGMLLIFILLWATSTYGGQFSNNDNIVEEKEDTKVLIVATVAWVLRKISRAITLLLLFLLVIKPGLVHAAYSTDYSFIILYIVFIKSLIDFIFVFLSSKIVILDGNFMLFMIHKTNLIIKVILFSIFALCGNLQRVLMFSLISVCFFLVFLLSHSISKKMRQALIIFCEVHFSLLYILQLDLISKSLERSGSLTLVFT